MGGVADVVRDLPVALDALRWQTTVVTPAYGSLHCAPGARRIDTITVPFRGAAHAVEVYEVPGNNDPVRNVVFEAPAFSPQGPGVIYCSDPEDAPFAADADKFALFSAALAEYVVGLNAAPDVLHLHDWHTGYLFLLRAFDTRYAALRAIRTVFTVHNLAYQGTRPLAGHDSSLESWFPGLGADVAAVRDPEHADCINPMAAAIRLADRISTVSPTYAGEICRPSDPARGFIGGEGLETELSGIAADGGLVGILNGCEYPRRRGRKPSWLSVVDAMQAQVTQWRRAGRDTTIHELAARRIAALPRRRPRHIMLSIGRLVAQKVSLFLEETPDGCTALEQLLQGSARDGVLVLLGSGDDILERQVFEIAGRCPNLIFLRGYSETLAAPLYRTADLFLMPSSFEPCGISQMLSMRVGVPCVVHGVGGLRDTVEHGVTGFVFDGSAPAAQAAQFVSTVRNALDFIDADPDAWRAMKKAAASARFDWRRSARMTINELYEPRN